MTARQLILTFRRLAWPAVEPTKPANRGSRPRSTVLWGLTTVVAAHLGFSLLLETALPEIRHPEHGKRLVAVRQLRRDHPHRPLVVAIGSSRTQNAVSAGAMSFPDEPGSPLVFNYGQVGALPAHLPILARRLEDCGVETDVLLVEIFPALLTKADAGQTGFGELGSSLTAVEIARLAPATSGAITRDRWLKSRFNPWYTYRRMIQHEMLDGWVTDHARNTYRVATYCDPYGFSPFGYTPFGPAGVTDEERQERLGKVYSEYSGLVARLHVSELTLQSYRDLVAACRTRGTPVAFFVPPESPTFQSWYTPESRAALADFYRILTQELGCPVFVAPNEYAETDFADGHHMLPEGAAKFSRWLADTHLKLWLAEVLK